MKGLVVPEQGEDFTADPVELFFDLAYVLAFSQLVGVLIHHPDWRHVGEASLVFAILWLAWSQLTWAANAVAGNSRTVRVVFLVATATSVPMAASVSTALDNSGLLFAIPVVVIVGLGLVLAIEGNRDSDGRPLDLRYAGFVAAFGVLLVGGAVADTDARIVVWLIACVVFLTGAISTGRSDWTLRAGHFAERHGLIIIIALGEVVIAVGKPLVESLEEGESIPIDAVVALIAAGVFACTLWWSYFDRVQPALEHRVEETPGPARSTLARDDYTFAHLLIVAGVIATAAGLEEITLHPDQPLPFAFRMMLLAGLALFLGGIGLAIARTFRVVATERLVGLAAIVLLLLAGGDLDGVWLIVGIDIVLITVLAFEHRRVEVRPTRSPNSTTAQTG